MASTPLLELNNISKSFLSIKALSNISIKLHQSEVLGLIGENGAGKSTLMNILGGVVPPDSGEMTFKDLPYTPENPNDAIEKGFAFIHQELNLFPNLTIYENLFIDRLPRHRFLPAIDRKPAIEQTAVLLRRLGLDASPAQRVETLPPGERQLIEIAKALSRDADIYLFDEPTTSLTPRETGRLFEVIKELKLQGKGIIYISHILDDVKHLADSIIVLRDGALTATGNIEDFDVPAMIRAMVGRDFSAVFPPHQETVTEEKVLELNGIAQPGIVADISFSLHRGEKLGVFGLMGSGRTELARIIYGLDDYQHGEILVKGTRLPQGNPRVAAERGVAFVTEDRRGEGLFLPMSVQTNIGATVLDRFSTATLGLVDGKKLDRSALMEVKRLRVKCADPSLTPAKALSGGNRQKVVIAKWLMAGPDVIMLDEPTRGIDIKAKSEVYSIISELAEGGAGVLMISSELEEVMGVCNRIIVMSLGRIIRIFDRQEFDTEQILAAAFQQEIDYA